MNWCKNMFIAIAGRPIEGGGMEILMQDIKKKNVLVKKGSCKYFFLIIIMYLLIILPYFFSVMNTIFSADDFSFAAAILQLDVKNDNYFRTICEFAFSRWYTWSGGWLIAIFPTGVNPLVISRQPFLLLEIEMSFFFLAFVISFIMLMDSVMTYLFCISNRLVRHGFILLSLFVVLNTQIYSEIFYWYTGTNYICRICSELICIALMIKFFMGKDDKRTAVFLGISGFYACNGLQGIVPVLLIYLFLWFRKYKREQKVCFQECFFFLLFLTSSLLNVCAPGNFARHHAIDETGIHVFDAVGYTCNNLVVLSIQLFANPVVFIFMISFLLLGFVLFYNEIKLQHMFWVIITFVILMFGMMFPVSLGYSSTVVPNRVFFVFAVHFLFCVGIILVFIGNYAAQRIQIQVSRKMILPFILSSIIVIYFSLSGWLIQSPYYITLSNLHSDKLIHNQYVELLCSIDSSDDRVVELDISHIGQSPVLKTIGFSQDAQYWVNEAIALFYEKDAVILITE